jgi:hypothetical protein
MCVISRGFVHGLNLAQVRLGDENPLPVDELEELRPGAQMVVAIGPNLFHPRWTRPLRRSPGAGLAKLGQRADRSRQGKGPGMVETITTWW